MNEVADVLFHDQAKTSLWGPLTRFLSSRIIAGGGISSEKWTKFDGLRTLVAAELPLNDIDLV